MIISKLYKLRSLNCIPKYLIEKRILSWTQGNSKVSGFKRQMLHLLLLNPRDTNHCSPQVEELCKGGKSPANASWSWSTGCDGFQKSWKQLRNIFGDLCNKPVQDTSKETNGAGRSASAAVALYWLIWEQKAGETATQEISFGARCYTQREHLGPAIPCPTTDYSPWGNGTCRTR